MKKIFAGMLIVLAVGACVCLCACGGSKEEPADDSKTTLENPLEETTLEGQEEATGISLPAPEGAQNVSYFVYKTDNPMAETRFEYQGVSCCLRAQSTGLVEFPMTAQEYVDSLANKTESTNEADISGMYYQWTSGIETTIQERPAQCFLTDTDGGVGTVLWLDQVPGIMYSLSISGGATQDLLLQVANASFVPMQGDVG